MPNVDLLSNSIWIVEVDLEELVFFSVIAVEGTVKKTDEVQQS